VNAHAASARLLIGGVSSGVGKTTFSVGLCRALMRRGLRVHVFKCGPDYLDPGYHRRASGQPVHNLDGWLMGPDAVRSTFARNAADCDVALIEGVMGLFDGASPSGLSGSSAEIAQLLGAPIALICDVSGMARSIAALAHGFASFEPGVHVAALIGNRAGSASHLELLRTACESAPGTGTAPPPRLLGGLLQRDAHAFPERHLGLHAAEELDLEPAIEAWADQVQEHCDLDALLALARSAPPLAAGDPEATVTFGKPAAPRCRLGVAHDEAFQFYYDENLRLLERAGAELVHFSPLRDARLPDVDGLYLGGGYPELHAATLAANSGLMHELRAFAGAGHPVYAECGGLMYLSSAIVTSDGQHHPMLDLVPGVAVMSDRLQALGYVEVETREASPLGPSGTRFRGHQFRYSTFQASESPSRYTLQRKRTGQSELEGYGQRNVLASYVHAHWASNPGVPEAFVEACVAAKR
jgi:cobyrinic acid a,c-diamide synthase